MYTTILVAVALQDWERYSPHALMLRDVAAAMALSGSKRLHVLSVYHYDGLSHGSGLSLEMVARAREDLRQRTETLMQHKLEEYVAPLKDAGLEIIPLLEPGNPRTVIPRVAQEVHADVLVIGSHSKRGIFDAALGGTARQLHNQTPCPLVLVSPKPS